MAAASTSEPVLPAAYPFAYERHFTLDDGRRVWVRPVVPTDAPALGREIEATDGDTLYQRFFNPSLRITDERLRLLTQLDYTRRFAVAAFDVGGAGVAIARFEASAETCAELAVVVKPGWRGAGLATVLLALLEEAAAERGFTELEALYLAENHAIGRVLDKRGFGPPVIDAGVARVTKQIDSALASGG